MGRLSAEIIINGNRGTVMFAESVGADLAGYTFAGEITPSSEPRQSEKELYYIATTPGTYTNFGGIHLIEGEFAFIYKQNGSWVKTSEVYYKPNQDYDSSTGKMGYKVLQTESKATFQSQVTEPNTIYEIRDVFDLGGTQETPVTFTMPANCTLRFNGGLIKNCTIQGNKTKIDCGLKQVFDSTVLLRGHWLVDYFDPVWWGADRFFVNDSTAAFQACFTSVNTSGTLPRNIGIFAGNYKINDTLEINQSDMNVFGLTNTGTVRLYWMNQESVTAFRIKGENAHNSAFRNLQIVLNEGVKQATADSVGIMFKKADAKDNTNDSLNGIDAEVLDCEIRGFANSIQIFGIGLFVNRTRFGNFERGITITTLNDTGKYGGPSRVFRINECRFHGGNQLATKTGGCINIISDLAEGFNISNNYNDSGATFINCFYNSNYAVSLRRAVVSNNTITMLHHLNPASNQTADFIRAQDIKNCSITGNVVANHNEYISADGVTTIYPQMDYFIYLKGYITGSVISDNLVRRVKFDVINVDKIVMSNVINNNFGYYGLDSEGTYYAFKVNAVQNSIIEGNNITEKDLSSQTNFMNNTVTVSNCSIIDNILVSSFYTEFGASKGCEIALISNRFRAPRWTNLALPSTVVAERGTPLFDQAKERLLVSNGSAWVKADGSSITPYTVTKPTVASHVTGSNNSNTAEVREPYLNVLSAASGYTISTVSVTMGGVDVTSLVYDLTTHVIYIPSVIGDIVITATATA